MENKRPSIYDQTLKKEMQKEIGKIIYEWGKPDFDLEDCIEAAENISYSYGDDGYDLAKKVEMNHYLSHPNAQLVEDLDRCAWIATGLVQKHTKLWVLEYNIKLEIPIGAKVMVKINGKIEEGEIVKTYPDVANYGVWTESLNRPKGEGNWVLHREDVESISMEVSNP